MSQLRWTDERNLTKRRKSAGGTAEKNREILQVTWWKINECFKLTGMIKSKAKKNEMTITGYNQANLVSVCSYHSVKIWHQITKTKSSNVSLYSSCYSGVIGFLNDEMRVSQVSWPAGHEWWCDCDDQYAKITFKTENLKLKVMQWRS